MEDVFNQVPCLIFSVSEEGTLLSINEAACNHLGYVKQELEGKKAETIFTLPTRIFQETHLFPLLKMQGKAEEIYITLLTKGGEYLPVLVNATQKKSNNHTVTFYAGIVVHNRKK
ncbi:MAG: PAS domain S-box protein, partial [Chitinophagaceae bacterium]